MYFFDKFVRKDNNFCYQRDILYDILNVTPPLFRDDQAGLLQAVIFVQAKQNLVWLTSLTAQCSQRGNGVNDFLRLSAFNSD